MKKTTVDDTLKTYLEQFEEFDEADVKMLVKNFHKDIKKKKKGLDDDDEEDDSDSKIRHGTTCFGIIDKNETDTCYEG